MSDNEILTINEAAKLASVSRRTIYNWIHHGILPFKQLVNGRIRIESKALFRDNFNERDARMEKEGIFQRS